MTLYLVGRAMSGDAFQFQGIFTSEEKAVAACRDATYFVGTAEVDQELPHEIEKWPEAWYPRLESREEGRKRFAVQS